jgi:predicted phosphodiesterase
MMSIHSVEEDDGRAPTGVISHLAGLVYQPVASNSVTDDTLDENNEESVLMYPVFDRKLIVGRTAVSTIGGILLLVALLIAAAVASKQATTDACNSIRGCEFSYDRISRPTLQFCQVDNSSNTTVSKFKIIQLTDIHLGEAENLEWGPEQDRKTWEVLDKVLTLEAPDLIILSGDQLTANNCKDNATAYYRLLGEFLTKYNTPWATIFGNHDDLGFVNPETEQVSPPKFSRRDLLQVDQSFPLSLSEGGPVDVFGTSNYVLNISNPENATVAAQIYLFDSGGGALPEAIHESQLHWFHEHQSSVPAIAFQHIPTETHLFSNECSGFHGEGIAELRYDAGIVRALADTERFAFLAVGHNHGNDYCCSYNSTTNFKVCFGRHSGYGGYGKWERGARVYELTIDGMTSASMQWKSWVRLESGELVDEV